MIYSNVELKKQKKEMDWGVLTQFQIGEEGRGRKAINLPCPSDIEIISSGLHKDLTIGLTKSGRPRINKGEDDRVFIILSTKGGYTRRGDGVIFILQPQRDRVRLVARGNGADGDAGRIGTWDCALLEVTDNTIIRFKKSGGDAKTEFLVIKDKCVYHADSDTLEDCCESLQLELPEENWYILDYGWV